MDPHDPPVDPAPSTDDVLSESVERVRSSRQLLDEIEERLRRSERLLKDDAGGEPTA